MSFLKEIIAVKKQEVKLLKKSNPHWELQKRKNGFFYSSLNDSISIIAEIKKASPAMGVLRKEVDIAGLAQIYQNNGANAISVLTDQKYFQGSIDYLKEARKGASIPLLRKDFIIHPLQIEEACFYEADAILLIATILSTSELKKLIKKASDLGLDCLLEVHNEEDLKKALKTDCPLIGINNRDLHTFQIDLNTSLRLAPKIPKERKIVVESGISSLKDIQLFLEVGIHCFLIGKFLMEQNDPGGMLKSIKSLK